MSVAAGNGLGAGMQYGSGTGATAQVPDGFGGGTPYNSGTTAPVADGSVGLAAAIDQMLRDAVAAGQLAPAPAPTTT
jgi:hypothetical protein